MGQNPILLNAILNEYARTRMVYLNNLKIQTLMMYMSGLVPIVEYILLVMQ